MLFFLLKLHYGITKTSFQFLYIEIFPFHRFPLKDSISAVIGKYSRNGYLDILTEKWYGSLPCHNNGIEIIQPRPLGKEWDSYTVFKILNYDENFYLTAEISLFE